MRGQATRISNELLEYLDSLRKELVRKIQEAPALNNPRHMAGLFREVDSLIDDIYGDYQRGLTDKLIALADYESEYVKGYVLNAVGEDAAKMVSLSQTRLKSIVLDDPFDGKILREWISDQQDGLKSRVRQQIRLGVGAGEGADKLAKRVFDEGYDKAKRHAVALARTATNHISNTANYESFKQAGVRKYQISAILDSRTTKICASMDGKIFSYDDETAPRPPFHPNCRTIIVPVFGETRVKKTYGQWFKEQPESEKRKILGSARYELYKKGMKIEKFVDENQHVLTLDELRTIETA